MIADEHSAVNACAPNVACGKCHSNIVDPAGFVLMATPKVASQSILAMYRQYSPRAQWLSKEYVLDYCKGRHFITGFVRNPFARLVSCYVDKCVNQGGYRTWPIYGMTGSMTFDEFARRACEIPHHDADKHWRGMSFDMFHMEHRQLKSIPDCIVRLENLQHDWALARGRIYAATGVVLNEIPHQHKTGRKPYQKYYTPELVELVGDYYHDDLVNFDYSFENQQYLPLHVAAV